MDAQELLKQGGDWLGAVRRWIQWNVRGGDRVTWGSDDEPLVGMTVRQAEALGAEAAAAALAGQAADLAAARQEIERLRGERDEARSALVLSRGLHALGCPASAAETETMDRAEGRRGR